MGSRQIPLYGSPTYDVTNNCTAGFFELISQPDPSGSIMPLYSYNWLPSTCEADLFCQYSGRPQALPCSEGYVCPEATTALTSSDIPCAGGFVCALGTTPDVILAAPQGQFKVLCPRAYYCQEGTGPASQFRSECPNGYFCPSGTFNPFLGKLGNDAVVRLFTRAQADVFSDVVVADALLPGVRLPVNISSADQRCFWGINSTLMASDRTALDNRGRLMVINLALEQDQTCARDSAWHLNADAINRAECDCVSQVAVALEVARMYFCTESPFAVAGPCEWDDELELAPMSVVGGQPTGGSRSPGNFSYITWRRDVIAGNLLGSTLANGTYLTDLVLAQGVQVPMRSVDKRYFKDCEATISSPPPLRNWTISSTNETLDTIVFSWGAPDWAGGPSIDLINLDPRTGEPLLHTELARVGGFLVNAVSYTTFLIDNCTLRALGQVAPSPPGPARLSGAGAPLAGTGLGLAADAVCPVFCSFRELKEWLETPGYPFLATLRTRTVGAEELATGRYPADLTATLAAKQQGLGARANPLLFDLKYAVDLLDDFTSYARQDLGDDDLYRFGDQDAVMGGSRFTTPGRAATSLGAIKTPFFSLVGWDKNQLLVAPSSAEELAATEAVHACLDAARNASDAENARVMRLFGEPPTPFDARGTEEACTARLRLTNRPMSLYEDAGADLLAASQARVAICSANCTLAFPCGGIGCDPATCAKQPFSLLSVPPRNAVCSSDEFVACNFACNAPHMKPQAVGSYYSTAVEENAFAETAFAMDPTREAVDRTRYVSSNQPLGSGGVPVALGTEAKNVAGGMFTAWPPATPPAPPAPYDASGTPGVGLPPAGAGAKPSFGFYLAHLAKVNLSTTKAGGAWTFPALPRGLPPGPALSAVNVSALALSLASYAGTNPIVWSAAVTSYPANSIVVHGGNVWQASATTAQGVVPGAAGSAGAWAGPLGPVQLQLAAAASYASFPIALPPRYSPLRGRKALIGAGETPIVLNGTRYVLASSAGSALGASRLSPSRVDVCLCESALRCPNGTTSPFRSASIYDCQKSGNEVLRRLVPFAADFPHFSDAPFGPDDNKVLRDLFVDLGGLPFTRILAGQQ